MWVSKETVNKLKTRIDELVSNLKKLEDQSYLIGIERVGKKNKFIFVRNNEVIEVETMGLISDDIPEWKRKLLR